MTSQESGNRESGPQQSTRRPPLGQFTSPADGSQLARMSSNIREFFQPTLRARVHSSLLIDWHTGFGSFAANLRELFAKPDLAGIPAGAHHLLLSPVSARHSDKVQMTRVQALSLSIHILVLTLIIMPLLPGLGTFPTSRAIVPFERISISPAVLARLLRGPNPASGSGTSGEHNPIPPTVGQAPRFDWRQMAAPILHTAENPRLQVPASLVGPPVLKLLSPNLPNYGDPKLRLLTNSAGPGDGGGIGSNQGHGIGDGTRDGYGLGDNTDGMGIGVPGGTNGYGFPSCAYCPHAEFTDEAVKAKVQGAVIITAIIGIDGRARDIHVSQGLGFGLDEKAKEAVSNWRFKPALGPDGKLAAVRVPIEVDFHLL